MIGATYPSRPPYFAQKVIRAMTKVCAAQEIGPTGFALVALVAAQEDACRYRKPITFFNGQIMPLLGIGKWDTFDAARRKAVHAGWLFYQGPPKGKRSVPGTYWTLIPKSAAGLDDSPIGEEWTSDDTYRVGFRDGYEAARRGEPYPENGDGGESTISEIGDSGGIVAGTVAGQSGGTSLPIPYALSPTPISSSRKRDSGRETSKTSKTKKHKFTEADRETAQWMFSKIRAINPDHKEPNLDAWANDVRLMRERDEKTDGQIRELFNWANADTFWRSNILSPAKLRKQWDTLTIRRHGNGGDRSSGTGSQGQGGRRGVAVGGQHAARPSSRYGPNGTDRDSLAQLGSAQTADMADAAQGDD